MPSVFMSKEEAVEQNKGSAWTEYSKARSRGILRAVVAGYLVYLGGSIIYELIQGTTTLRPALGWILGPLFMIAGAGFGYFTWRRWKADEKAVEALTQAAKAAEEPGRDDTNEPA